MRVVEVTRAGPPEVLQVRTRPDPAPKPDEVVISVKASGVNFADIMGRMGLYPDAPPIPYVPGYEVSGQIETLGSQVTRFRPGDRVLCLTRFQGYADKVCLPANQVFSIPEGFSYEDAAAIPVTYLTAWVAMIEMGRIRAGDKILLHQAAGGVGVAALQIARHFGAETLGTVSSPAKVDFILKEGANRAFVRDQGDLANTVREFTHGVGLDLILEPRGALQLKEGFKLLAPAGRTVLFGVSDLVTGRRRNIFKALLHLLRVPKIKPYHLVNDNAGIFGLNMLTYGRTPEPVQRAMSAILKGLSEKWLNPRVDKSFPFDRAAEAHAYIQDRKNQGKVVLVP
jgi:NADPH:quinone reductase-like Zn-dependent oxidoreductase